MSEIERELEEEATYAPTPVSEEVLRAQGMLQVDSESLRHAKTLIEGAVENRSAHERYEAELGEPLSSWVASLPKEAKEEGILTCAVWHEMVELRAALLAAINERKALPGVFEIEAKRVMDVRMLSLRGRIRRGELLYRDIAEPFFKRHGRPPLPNVEGQKEFTPSGKQVLRQRKWLRSRYADLEEMASEDKHWKNWLGKITGSERSTALRVRVLYEELAALRTRLVTEVLTKPQDDPQAQESLETLKPDLIRVDREYHALAEPLFAKYGKPAFLTEQRQERSDEEKAG